MLFSISEPIEGASADLLGSKGFGLWQMKAAGILVPPAYVITTDVCREYMVDPEAAMKRVEHEFIPAILKGLYSYFGYMPLVSVRSGAKFSMPGMMDTVLNVGLDPTVETFWCEKIGSNCAADSMKRLIEMYGSVVNGIERKRFEGKSLEERLIFYKLEIGHAFPEAGDQLLGAIEAVFKSWGNERAKIYRRLNSIPEDLGTAVVVQAMVFGNMNDQSCTGVLFSRNPSNGTNEIVGEYLVNAQGEDVVAGIRTPESLKGLEAWNADVSAGLLAIVALLEKTNRDMQDVEFTVQDGKLFILQTRSAKRTAQAAVKVAVDMVAEKLISIEEALERVTLRQFLSASRPLIPAGWLAKNPAHGVGIPASNGCATGVAVFSSKVAIDCKEPCILVAEETTPDDIGGMNAAVGILTSTGGATSHAALVARGMDKVCVVGCTALKRTVGSWFITTNKIKHVIKEGTRVTLDGGTGSIWVGDKVPVEGGTSSLLVAQFFDLLGAKYDFYRTVTTVEEMAGASKMLVATYLLDRYHSGDELEAVALELFTSLFEREALIDLRAIQSVVREADAPVEFMWGALNKETDAVDLKIRALIKAKGDLNLAKIKVLGLGLEKDQVGTLKENGFTIVPAVSTLDELLDASGVCIPDFDALLKTVSERHVSKIVEMKKTAGEELKSFNIVEEIEADKLGRSAEFALSAIQAAQSFLRKEG